MTWSWPGPGSAHSCEVLYRLRIGRLAHQPRDRVTCFSMECEKEYCKDSSALRQWKFRVARMNGDDNPYRHLIPESLLEHTTGRNRTEQKKTGLPLIVQLNGGIGDHIEALSLLLPWAKAQNYCLDLEMSAQRQQQIGPLLHQWEQIRCNQERKVQLRSQ